MLSKKAYMGLVWLVFLVFGVISIHEGKIMLGSVLLGVYAISVHLK